MRKPLPDRYNPSMPDKPHDATPPIDDDDLYELAEDPDDLPDQAPPPPPGVSTEPGTARDPLHQARDPRDAKSKPAPAVKSDDVSDSSAAPEKSHGSHGQGGQGAASHFSGDDPEYVNPEIARMRREDRRIAAAEAQALADAKRKKVILIAIAVVAVLAAAAWFMFA